MTFNTEIRIHFDEADPAGIAFSGEILTKMHRCYEEFIEALGLDPKEFFLSPKLIYPLRHVEVEYFKPLLPLSTYKVAIGVTKISDSSFQLQYNVQGSNGDRHCQLRSTHVCVDPAPMKKSDLPDPLRESLKKFVIAE